MRMSVRPRAPGRKSALKITNLSTGRLTRGFLDPPTGGGQETSLCMHRPHRQQPLVRGGWIDLLDDPEPKDDAEAQVLIHQPPPGIARFAVYCDESGTHDARYYGFGSLWMPYQRRGEFSALMKVIRSRLRYGSEFKWHKVRSENQSEYLELVEAFFAKSWLSFHMILVDKEWVDLAAATVTVPASESKNGKEMIICLVPEAVEIIRGRMPGDNLYIFPGRVSGHAQDGASWLKDLRRRMRERGVTKHFTIHDVRRTMATRLVAAGVNLPIISAALGHSSMASTAVYARTDLDMVRAALSNIS